MDILTWTILKKTQILNGCKTFAFKYIHVCFLNTKDSNEMAHNATFLSMSTLTDLQRNKCNILPWEIITYDPLDSTMKLPKSLLY